MKIYSSLVMLSAAMNCAASKPTDPLIYASIPDDTYIAPKQGLTTLLDVIKSRDDLSALARGLQEPAGFAAAFDTPATWNFTFFAPSDTAFNNTGAYFSTFRATPKGKWWLGNLLTHHYIPNTILTRDKFNETLSRLQTATYMYLSTQQIDGLVTINKVARITEADIPIGNNGVMHIIDRILDPSAQLFEAELPKVSQGFIPGSCSNPQLPYC
ncbi:hypothetical protein SVAN01_03402 [Stagonosporopsis vannaccii]|nr:hypothetical protein SVAN01_03402 [Stagonosporopsis vannaccii]